MPVLLGPGLGSRVNGLGSPTHPSTHWGVHSDGLGHFSWSPHRHLLRTLPTQAP
jgi:hypothetical protein